MYKLITNKMVRLPLLFAIALGIFWMVYRCVGDMYVEFLERNIPIDSFTRHCVLLYTRSVERNQLPVVCNSHQVNVELCGVSAEFDEEDIDKRFAVSDAKYELYKKYIPESRAVLVVPVEPISPPSMQDFRLGISVDSPLTAGVFVPDLKGGTYINAKMLELGYAKYDQEVSRNCPQINELRQANAKAKREKLGLYSILETGKEE